MRKRWCPLVYATCLWATDVTTQHNDNFRTGLNPNETILTTANVNANTFGKLGLVPLNGNVVDGQPLYAQGLTFNSTTRNVVYVATEGDNVYAIDADTFGPIWQVSLLKTGEAPSDPRNCAEVNPVIGVISTPVISRSIGPHGTIYVVAMSKDSAGGYHQRLHALDLTTGAEQFGGPVDIQATFPGTGDNTNGTVVSFDPAQYKQRAGLLLANGSIYTTWASHCDTRPYTGWVIAYSATTLAQSSVFNFTPNGIQGAVWGGGGGPAADANGNIFFLAANGTFDSTLDVNGFPAMGDYGNAFMKLSSVNGNLSVADYFAMSNVVSEDIGDIDLGSGGAVLLPDMVDANGVTRHLAVGTGKDRHIYVVDRDNMGKFNPTTNNNYQDLPAALPGGGHGMPAFFNNSLYYGAQGDSIRKFTFANAVLGIPAAATGPDILAPGATPSISANGTTNGIVWASARDVSGGSSMLYAYDANNLHQLYNTNQAASSRDQIGQVSRYVTPTIVNGKVYLATLKGLTIFGLLPTQKPVITSGSSVTAKVNVAAPSLYQITATNYPMTFSATGLPAGLTLNPFTGWIGGTPTTTGKSTVTIRATNVVGSATAKLAITVK